MECGQEGCRRKTKRGCSRGMCQRCCFAFKRGVEQSPSLEISNATTSFPFPRLCPVHKDKSHKKGQQQAHSSSSSSTGNSSAKSSPRVAYKSPCKVVLVGLGADEQMAGYGRHRTVYLKDGEGALVLLPSDLFLLCLRI